MNDAKTMSSYHFGKRLISLVLAVMLVIGLCASGISVNAATTRTASTGADQYVYKLVDSIKAGNDYLIVNKNTSGSAYALKNDGGSSSGTSLARASVTVKSADVDKDGSADLYITSPSSNVIWTATANAEGVSLTNSGDYLEGKSGNLKIFSEQQYPDRYWHYTDQQLIFENPETGDRAVDYTLYYSSSNFTQSTSSNSNKIYIYEKTAVDEIPAEVETQAPTTTPITGNYVFKLTDTMKAGGEYLIVNKDEAGSAYALTNEGGSSSGTSLARTSVTVTSGDLNSDNVADTYIASATTDLVWAATANGEGFTLTNNGEFLEGKSNNIKIYTEQQNPDRYWKYEDSQLKFAGGSSTYTMHYSSSNFTGSTSSSSGKLYIYEKVAVDQIPTQVVTQAPTSAPITGDFVFKYVETMTPGHDYLIVSKNEAGSAYAMKNEGGSSSGTSMARSSVTISSGDVDKDGSADLYIAEASSDIVWTATANEGGFNLTNGSDILEGKSGNVKIYDSVQYSDRYWTYNDQLLQHNGGQNTYTVYYSSSSFTSSYQDTAKVYAFEKTATNGSVQPATQAPATQKPTSAPITGDFVFKYVETMTPGHDYLIVSKNEAGSAYAMKNEGGSSSGTSMARTSVTVSSGDVDKDGSADLYIAEAPSDIVWTATANGNGFNLTNGSDYLEGKSGNVKIFSSVQYSDRYWTYNDQLLQHNGGQNTYTVYYSSSSFTSSYQDTAKVYAFEKTATNGSVQPATQAPATQAPATQKPTSAPYTGNAVNVGFTSDVHDSTSDLRSWITYVQNAYEPDLDAMGYCGDYSYQMNKSSHVASFNEIVSITNELVGENKGCYTTGNHEWMNASGIVDEIKSTPNFKIFGELRKTDAYTIFAMGAESQSDAYTEEDIEALDQYLASTYTDRPVFIITHFPLHTNSSRTTKNADKVIDVCNKYPNVVWLWGHNHSQSDSHYGEILTAGDSINYASGKNKQINFTYLAAGGMYRESQVKNNSGLVCTIEGSDVTFRYHRSSTGAQVGDALKVSMIGEPVVNPTSAPATQKPTAAPITGDYVFQLTDTMKAGGEYLIVNSNSAGSGYSLKNSGGSSSGTDLARNSVNIQKSDLNNDGVEDTYIVSGTTDTVWLASANVDGYRLSNNGDYLEGKSNKISIYSSVQNSDRYWTYSNNQLKFAGGSSTYSFYYSSSNFTGSTSSNSGKLYIYEKTGVNNMPTEVKPTEAPPIVQGEGTNLGFTSDVHGSMDRLENWLTAVQGAYDPDLDAMTYCGDYSYEMSSMSSYLADFNSVVDATNRIIGEGKGIYTSGNHEYYINNRELSSLDSGFTSTPGFVRLGEAKVADNYRIYCFGAAGWFSANGEYPQADIDALDAYLDSAPTDVPIFIAAHFPLHYFSGSSSGWGGSSGRTITNADKVIDVLNDHPNAIFFWGHNHSQSDPNYGTIKKAGSSITYANGKSKEINFTYASVGAIYDDDQTRYSGVVATVSDSGDQVTFRYFNAGDGKQLGDTYVIDIEGGASTTTYTITASAAANGKISPDGAVSVKKGSSKTFTVTANAGYDVDTVTVDGRTVTLTNGKYTFSNVTANHTIRATFKQAQVNTYTASDGAVDGTKYLVVSNGYALRNNNGKIDAIPVTVSDDGKTVYVSQGSDNEDIYWTFKASTTTEKAGDFTVENDGYKLSRVTNSEDANNALEITKEDKYSEYSGLPYFQFSYDAANNELSMRGGQEGDDIFYAYYNTSEGAFYTNTSADGKLRLYTVAETTSLRGDADDNGVVEILDATVIQRYLAEITPNEMNNAKNADADLNGTIDIMDALAIQRVQAGIFTWAELDQMLKS